MDHALRELVCNNLWTHPQEPGFLFKFNQDGTGEVGSWMRVFIRTCRELKLTWNKVHGVGQLGLGWLFVLSMQWKSIPVSRSTADILDDECFKNLKHTNILTKRPTLLGSLRLEIRLDPNALRASNWPCVPDLRQLNDQMLSEAAYLPRQFTIIVEKGNFAAASGHAGRRELRMTFDTSPYPTVDGYNHERRRGPPWNDIHEWLSQSRSFYAGKPSDELLKARATEDDTIMGYHTSNCVIS